ncbi:hypothetical protein [Paenibacillus sp. B2(2019)]|uniref:glycoside hydrolase family 38 N-terminal domain-containing protein n=1 Tax=Paenibacillus sp. B2(2019) TaxID=2607754 RepID=UPI00166000CA|nr:hypothetical protein [Paenibacillus sp. B2(2019)]
MQRRDPFTFFIIQHSHIDIGYTERQEVITEYQTQFVEQAVELALSPEQLSRDDNAKFKFMLEGFWAVEKYLSKTGSSGRAKLVEALKSGNIELTAFYLHLTELLDEGHLRDTLKPALEFATEEGIPLVSAMSCDVNGFSWGMVDALYDAGVKYLSTNINTHHGGCPFGKPNVPFYWESPQGNRILVWQGLTYHKANLLGIIPGYNMVGNPYIPGLSVEDTHRYVDVQDMEYAEKSLFPLAEGLRNDGYEYEFIPIMGSGLYTDNSPPTDSYCELIRQWNDKHGDQIELRTATLAEYFAYLESAVPDIPVYRGDWNDWWTDGVISTALETSLFRNAQRTKRVAERFDPERKYVTEEEWKSVTSALVLYAEHTWGHSASLHRPYDFRVQQLLLRKTKYAVEADELSCIALDKVLAGKGQGDFTARRTFTYKVMNPSIETRMSLAYLSLDYWESPIFEDTIRVVDLQGRQYPYVRVNHSLRGQELCIQLQMEPLEEIELKLEFLTVTDESHKAEVKSVIGEAKGTGCFENDLLRVEWDDKKGVHTLIHKPSEKSLLVDGASGLGAPLYQLFEGVNRWDPAGFGYKARMIPKGEVFNGQIKRITNTGSNYFYETWEFEYDVRGAHAYAFEIKFYRTGSRFDLSVRLNKENILDPEGMYTSFPFQTEQGIWYLDKAGAAIRPCIDQLPNACGDYYSVQSGASLVGNDLGISITTLDAPMVHIGKLRLWDYTEQIEPTGPLYSWLTNNKWDTNFKASCGGFYEFRYTIDVNQAYTDSTKAIRACQENSYDFLAIRK